MRATPLLLLSLALAGCIPVNGPPPVPAPAATAVALPPPAPLASDWRDWPRTPGNWRYTSRAGGGDAVYGAGTTLVALACDRAAGRLTLIRPSPVAATAITIRTTSTVRTLPVQARAPADAAPLLMLDATLPVGDPLLDAMAFSRGIFTVEQAGQPPLVLPAWAEVGRVIQDCR